MQNLTNGRKKKEKLVCLFFAGKKEESKEKILSVIFFKLNL